MSSLFFAGFSNASCDPVFLRCKKKYVISLLSTISILPRSMNENIRKFKALFVPALISASNFSSFTKRSSFHPSDYGLKCFFWMIKEGNGRMVRRNVLILTLSLLVLAISFMFMFSTVPCSSFTWEVTESGEIKSLEIGFFLMFEWIRRHFGLKMQNFFRQSLT